MITGDYPVTAQSIARQAGLEHPEKVLTGPELDRLTDEELAVRIRDIQVFARVVPEQKLRIVNALKANREVVAMTGDGDNDAPALKSAQPPGKPNVGDFLTVHRRPQRKLGLN